MRVPRVSFVVPCYKLGHLLSNCVNSILSQSYADFEILIMDDRSPDSTPEVAQSFTDPRIRYLRNEQNLGHMRNYNRGVALARGTYVWLISADDCLRHRDVLQRFVDLMDRRPRVGYIFCPVMRFRGDEDLFVYGNHGPADRIFRGHQFLRILAEGNSVPAASVMARRACYEQQGMYPLDLPFANDWYVWAVFALAFDVAYMAEPMVGWRMHDANMTHSFTGRPAALVADELATRWRLRRAAEKAGCESVARTFLDAIASDYAGRVVRKLAEEWPFGLTEDEFEQSMTHYSHRSDERAAIRGVVYAALGDHYVDTNNAARARELYGKAIDNLPRALRTRLKYALLLGGHAGQLAREAIVSVRQILARSRRRTPLAGSGPHR